jgi:rfaE bifunctional protein nucleotidyltransferase chain/domain
VSFREKILSWETLPQWRAELRRAGTTLVVTNGCFDLLHFGHVTYLEQARALGQALLVGLNGNHSVQQLKGEGRPLNSEDDRAAVVAGLESVSAVCIFEDKSAAAFLARAQPDVYVKGGDYTLETINQNERKIVEDAGGRIVIIPFVPGRSTSLLLKKIAGL